MYCVLYSYSPDTEPVTAAGLTNQLGLGFRLDRCSDQGRSGQTGSLSLLVGDRAFRGLAPNSSHSTERGHSVQTAHQRNQGLRRTYERVRQIVVLRHSGRRPLSPNRCKRHTDQGATLLPRGGRWDTVCSNCKAWPHGAWHCRRSRPVDWKWQRDVEVSSAGTSLLHIEIEARHIPAREGVRPLQYLD